MDNQVLFLGHNAWKLTLDGYHILIDPFLTDNPVATCSATDLTADFILVSHGHGDHFGDTFTIAQRTDATVVAIAEIAGYVTKKGYHNTISMNIGGGVTLPFGRVQLTQAIHSSTLPDGTPGGNSAGFLLTLKSGKTLYFACDTALFGDMALLAEKHIDYAFLPIGDLFTMGPDDAMKAVKLIRPHVTIPCHYNTWKAIEQDAVAWKKRVEAETDTQVVVMKSADVLKL